MTVTSRKGRAKFLIGLPQTDWTVDSVRNTLLTDNNSSHLITWWINLTRLPCHDIISSSSFTKDRGLKSFVWKDLRTYFHIFSVCASIKKHIHTNFDVWISDLFYSDLKHNEFPWTSWAARSLYQPDSNDIKQLENSQISFISHWFYILIQEAKNSLIVSSQTGRVCVCLLTFPVQRENDISTKLANRCVKCDVWSVTLHLSLITGDFFYMNRI